LFAIDKYAYQNRLKNLPVAYKFVIYLLLLAASFSGVRSLQLGLIVLVAPLTCYVARLPWLRYLKWYLHASIFILISLLTFVLTYQNSQVQLLLALPLGQGYLGISQSSVQQTIFIGSATRSIAEPREILHYALKHMATSVILVHNHPSGAVVPSPNDDHVTKLVKEACELMGLILLDHLIVSHSDYFSYREKTDMI